MLVLALVCRVRRAPSLNGGVVQELIIELPFLAFDAEEHRSNLDMLPHAHVRAPRGSRRLCGDAGLFEFVLTTSCTCRGAQTCTNTLEIPNYQESLVEVAKANGQPELTQQALRSRLKEVLNTKLSLAIDNTSGCVAYRCVASCTALSTLCSLCFLCVHSFVTWGRQIRA